MSFNTWIDTLVDEKGYDLEHRFEVPGNNGVNSIPLGCVIDGCKQTTADEQAKIKTALVNLDFRGGDPLDYFAHLAKAIAR
ncbi:hypothetical protein GS896_27635 [Rhodococcus hoagii]|nr:hypothetical protein [Prescottella equi]MBM4654025.1 hypothetical protein [Prescottella equi]MBM4719714.1 hypothetical protein [Prescottella equi]NKR23509.1 hypothetical protein [Prescottella equi]NKT56337.1 hypothetical protein [Prescottella equi]